MHGIMHEMCNAAMNNLSKQECNLKHQPPWHLLKTKYFFARKTNKGAWRNFPENVNYLPGNKATIQNNKWFVEKFIISAEIKENTK